MRLIDADALKQGFESSDFDDDPFENVDNACRIVNSYPTIDAIPVEWLAQKARIEDGWGNIPFAEHIKLLIWEWHQQEDEE